MRLPKTRTRTRFDNTVINPIEWPRGIVVMAVCCLTLTAGCSQSSKVLYEEPDSEAQTDSDRSIDQLAAVGDLGRVAFLPVITEVSPENPGQCMDTCYPDRDRTEIALSAVGFLEKRLGYDVICLDPACRPETETLISDEGIDIWAKQLTDWASEHDDDLELPSELFAITSDIAKRLDVDGVIVVYGQTKYVKWADSAHWLATLSFSAYYNLIRGDVAKLRADIFSTQHGRRLWSGEATVYQIGNAQTISLLSAYKRYGVALFGELDPAQSEISEPH